MTVFQKAPRKNWYISVIDHAGERHVQSARTTDYEIACEREREAQRAVTVGMYLPPRRRRARDAIERLTLHQAVAEYLSIMVTNRASKAYVDWMGYMLFNFVEYFETVTQRGEHFDAPEDRSPCRLRQARWKRTTDLEALELLAPRATDRPVRSISDVLVEAFKAHRSDVDDADVTTVNGEVKALKIFGAWLRRRARLIDDPFENIGYVKEDEESPGRALSFDEGRALLVAADEAFAEWCEVVIMHGFRRREADHLRPEDIVVEDGYFHVRIHRDAAGEVVWTPKFGKERKVAFAEVYRPFAESLRNRPTDAQGHVLGLHDRRKARDRSLIASKINGHVRLHDLRHTAYTAIKSVATQRMDHDLALADVRLLFGHATGSMDERYDHRTVERLRRVAECNPLLAVLPELRERMEGRVAQASVFPVRSRRDRRAAGAS